MQANGKIFFEETQQFRVRWVWMIILLSVFSSIGLIVGIALTDKVKIREGLLALVFVVPFELAMLYLFYIVRLETIVTSEGIYYRWWPFQRRGSFISRTEIAEAEIRTGPSLSYGCNRVPGYGKVHNTGPGEGIQLVLRDGRKLFLGSSMSPSFLLAISKIVNVSRKAKTNNV